MSVTPEDLYELPEVSREIPSIQGQGSGKQDAKACSIGSLDKTELGTNHDDATAGAYWGQSPAVAWQLQTANEVIQRCSSNEHTHLDLPITSYHTGDVSIDHFPFEDINKHAWVDSSPSETRLEEYFGYIHEAFPILGDESFSFLSKNFELEANPGILQSFSKKD